MEENNFFSKVYEIVRLIPYGKVTTYGAIARATGSPQASRMVGWAMNQSHLEAEYVPAHRVVNRNGMLSGKYHFETPNAMESLLKNEGIDVLDDKIQNFKEHFWDPMVELKI